MSITINVSQAIESQFAGNRTEDTVLHKAAFEGAVNVLIENLNPRTPQEEIDQKNLLCCTPLRLAATGGHVECARLLLDHGASIDIPDVKGQTPLHVAVKNCHHTCARLLLERGADPNGNANNRSTPLSLAAMQGTFELVQLLLDFGADIVVHRRGCSGMFFTVDAMQLAIVYQHYECLKLLLAFSKDTPVFTSSFTGNSYSPYHVLVYQKGHRRYFELLNEFGVSLWVKDDKGRYPWEALVLEGENVEALRDFFDTARGEPRSLKSLCRLTTRKHLLSQRKNASVLRSLTGVPQAVLQYLTFEQL